MEAGGTGGSAFGSPPERYLAQRPLTALFAGDFDAALGEDQPPPSSRVLAVAVWHFARGMAHAALGDAARAEVESRALRGLPYLAGEAVKLWPDRYGRMPIIQLCESYGAILTTEVQRLTEPSKPASADRLRLAVAAFSKLPFDDPPPMYLPPYLFLGSTLLRGGDAFGALAAFGAPLAVFVEERGGQEDEALVASRASTGGATAAFAPMALFGRGEACAALADRWGYRGGVDFGAVGIGRRRFGGRPARRRPGPRWRRSGPARTARSRRRRRPGSRRTVVAGARAASAACLRRWTPGPLRPLVR